MQLSEGWINGLSHSLTKSGLLPLRFVVEDGNS